MKITSFAMLIFASCIVAKNLVYLENLAAASSGEANQKRAPKNVVGIHEFVEGVLEDESNFKLDERKVTFHDGNFINHNKDEKRLIPQRPLQPVPLLHSILSQVLQVSIFARYVRDDEKVLAELEDPAAFTLFVAPSDQAIATFSTSYSLKPWEFPEAVPGDATDDEVIGRNLDSFIRAHTSHGDPSIQSDNTLSGTLLNGVPYKIVKLDVSSTYVLEVDGQKIAVSDVRLAGNGIVFVIEKVLVSGKK